MMISGLSVVAPSTPGDVVGLLAAAVRDPDPVVVDELGKARVVREGTDCTILALALMVPRALEAADRLAADGISAEVVDIGSLVPLDTETILGSVEKTSRLFTVEENPSLCGWGAEITSIVSKETFWYLDGPIVRIATPHIPLPAADALEDMAIPSADRIYETVAKLD